MRYLNGFRIKRITSRGFVQKRDNAMIVTTHRQNAALWNVRGRLLKGRTTVKRNRYGLLHYCVGACNALKTILRILISFHDPVVDGDDRRPNVVWVSSIVLGCNPVKRTKFCLSAYLLLKIRNSDAPDPKNNCVFSRALETFGLEGPETTNNVVAQYDIVDAKFIGCTDHPTALAEIGLRQASFRVTISKNVDLNTIGTLHDKRYVPDNICVGDILRLEVCKCSTKDVQLEVPKDIGYLRPQAIVKPVAILDLCILGFVDASTGKYRVRPHVKSFLLHVSRVYHLATIGNRSGQTIHSGLFSIHYVAFVAEEDDLSHWLETFQLDSTNSFILGPPHTKYGTQLEHIHLSVYNKHNVRDSELDVRSDMCKFLMSLHSKSNIGVCVRSYNNDLN